VYSLCDAARRILSSAFDTLGKVATEPFERAVFLGAGCRFGAARESALKMLEMTGARVVTMAETYLGLRHGPMSFLDSKTLVVCFLASDPINRAYEIDLVDEIHRKSLGWRNVVVGEAIPRTMLRESDSGS
jgi:tagatose-6-phosphate ketose/aldose isomerase